MSSATPPLSSAVRTSKPPQAADRRLTLAEVLGDLVGDGLLTQTEADNLLGAQHLRKGETHPLVLISQQKIKDPRNARRTLTLESLTEWLAGKVGLPYMHIDPFKIDFAAVTKVMSNAYATRFRILPIQVSRNEAVIATCEPHVREWENELAQILRVSIKRVLSNPLDITAFQAEFYNLARSVRDASQNSAQLSDIANFEQLVELGRNGTPDANDRHIVHIVDWLLQYAFQQRASDIHVEPRRDSGNVRFRIDGVLHQVYQIPTPVMAAMTSRIKLLGRMDVVEKRRPQDGRIKTRTGDGREVELRLATMPTAFGEKLVMRIFDPEVLLRDFGELGFSDDELTAWNAMTSRPNGIVLVTGPTGSGKTTTLYTTLKRLATEEVNVCTVEDPIEMVEPSFNQMQVQPGIELGFADGVRALMRQDPDIIMVGEIRDLQTAEMAVQAALTGHLVFSTLHTNDAPSAVTRLIELGIPPYLINATVLGVLAQRLVRTLCAQCKAPDEVATREALSEVVKPWQVHGAYKPYKAVGCVDCRMTGFMGRMGLYELLVVTEEFKQKVSREPNVDALRRQAVQDGMRPLRLAGAMKVAEGLTTVEEVLRSTPAWA